VAAAISAARNGVKVTLVERYPYLGGMATGGLVLLFIEYDRYEYGILRETVERLVKLPNAIAYLQGNALGFWNQNLQHGLRGLGLAVRTCLPSTRKC